MKSKKIFSVVHTGKDLKIKPQYLTFLLMLYITFSLVGSAILYKVIQIGPLSAPGGILDVPIVLLMEDIIAEVYGYRISRTLLWYTLFSMLIFIGCVELIVHLPSPGYWHGQSDYLYVFGNLDKGVPIMVVGLFCGRFTNLYVITKLKILVKGRYFWVRSIFSSLIGDLISLGIIYGIAFWSLPILDRFHMFASDISVRLIYSIIGGGIGVLIVRFLKKREGIDIYDRKTSFNPFRINPEE